MMQDNDETQLFKCKITMDYQSETKTLTITRRAPTAVDVKNQLLNQLTGKNAAVALADYDGSTHIINSMKFGNITIEQAKE